MPTRAVDEDPLTRVVAEAVGEALDRRFRWMVTTSATVALLVSLAITLPLTILQNQATDAAAAARSRHNCRLVKGIAAILGSGDSSLRRGGFISSDARLRRKQVLDNREIAALRPGPLKALLVDPETVRLTQRSQQLDLATTRYWQTVLDPRLMSVARNDCLAG